MRPIGQLQTFSFADSHTATAPECPKKLEVAHGVIQNGEENQLVREEFYHSRTFTRE